MVLQIFLRMTTIYFNVRILSILYKTSTKEECSSDCLCDLLELTLSPIRLNCTICNFSFSTSGVSLQMIVAVCFVLILLEYVLISNSFHNTCLLRSQRYVKVGVYPKLQKAKFTTTLQSSIDASASATVTRRRKKKKQPFGAATESMKKIIGRPLKTKELVNLVDPLRRYDKERRHFYGLDTTGKKMLIEGKRLGTQQKKSFSAGAKWKFLLKVLKFERVEVKMIRKVHRWLWNLHFETKILPIYQLFKAYGFHNKVLRKITMDNPFVYNLPRKTVDNSIKLLKNRLQYTNRQLINILEHEPVILSFSTSRLNETINFFTNIVEFNQKQLQLFFKYQFRVWKIDTEKMKEYYIKQRVMGFSPEDIQRKLLTNKFLQKRFAYEISRVDGNDTRYLTEYVD
jgi:hypothetical protein